MKVTMWLVRKRDEIYVAYPRKAQAKVYASNFSNNSKIEIVECVMISSDSEIDTTDLSTAADAFNTLEKTGFIA